MMDLLRDPFWNGISGIIAIIALFIAIPKEKFDLMSLTQSSVIVISKALVGIFILLPFNFIRPAIYWIFLGGLPLWQNAWKLVLQTAGLSSYLWYCILNIFAAGLISALISSTGKTVEQSIQRAIISVAVTLALVDIYNILFHRSFSSDTGILIFQIICDIGYGFIAGPIIARVVTSIDKAFLQSFPNKNAG